jgi:hypothetical protein
MKTPGILKGLLFNESRKFGLGLWLLLIAVVFFGKAMLTAEQFMTMIMVVSALIGGGTLADTWLGKKKVLDATPAPTPPAQ